MASEATPRVNAKYLDSFTNQTVRILGKVVSLRGDMATIDASGSVNVHLNRVFNPNPVERGGTGGRIGDTRAVCRWKEDPIHFGRRRAAYAQSGNG